MVFALSIILSIPSIALAHHRYSPVISTPPSVSTSTSTASSCNGGAINFGYGPLTNGSYNLTVEQQQLQTLKNAGITCVRNAGYGQNPTWAYPLYLLEKSMGFYVDVTVDGNPTSSGYAQSVLTFAKWAQANKIDQFGIGNEASKNTQTVKAISSLSCQVKQVYSGDISYSTYLDTSFDEIKAYAQNKGCLTELDLNISASFASTAKEAQQYLPNAWGISELGVDMDAYPNISDATRASMTQTIVAALAPYNVAKYWFSYDAGGDGVANHWAMGPLTLKAAGL